MSDGASASVRQMVKCPNTGQHYADVNQTAAEDVIITTDHDRQSLPLCDVGDIPEHDDDLRAWRRTVSS